MLTNRGKLCVKLVELIKEDREALGRDASWHRDWLDRVRACERVIREGMRRIGKLL